MQWIALLMAAALSAGPYADPRTDVDQDGVVTIQDLLLVRANLNLPIAPPTTQPPDPEPTGKTMLAASRVQGVAPLPVFFDAVDPASGVVQPAGPELDYAWDFGDAGAGTWPTSGLSKNTATGYVAAHVYERPGTYVARLTVTTPAGRSYNYEQTITVSAFSGTTYYVDASAGNDGNTGTSPGSAFKTLNKAITVLGSNRRILFKRGQSFSTSTPVIISGDTMILGAYYYSDGRDEPSQAKPELRFTGKGEAWKSRSRNDATRLVNLKFIGPGSSSDAPGISIGDWSGQARCLVLNCDISGFATAVGCGNPVYTHESWVVGCTFTNIGSSGTTGNGSWFGGQKSAFMGTTSIGLIGRAEHNLRVWHALKMVIAHNVLRDPMNTKLALKLHNEVQVAPPVARYIEISDNEFRGQQYGVSIAPQNRESNERLSDVIFERNVVRSNPSSLLGLLISAQKVTVRNNLFIGTGAQPWYKAIIIERQGSEPAPTAVRVVNNTAYRADAGKEFVMLRAVAGTGLAFINNLACAPQTPATVLIEDAVPVGGGGNVLASSSAVFVDAELRPAAGSVAIDAGIEAADCKRDRGGTRRPSGSRWDAGAWEQ